MLDPGLGFAKTAEHNWDAAARPRRDRRPSASRCWSARQPQVVPRAACSPAPTGRRARSSEREDANVALTVLLAQRGVWGLRVHDVRASMDALRVAVPGWTTRTASPDPMTDELGRSRGIECYGHHGVFEFERREGQTFVVDLALGLDTRAAAAVRRLA